jgi:2-dehydropantoate 2-reductase
MTSSILIWGAGAIGGTIGAALARAGHNVTLMDTEADHVAAINANGLHISGPVETYVARPQAHTPQTLTGSYRLILLAVKAHHTAAATRMLRSLPLSSPPRRVMALPRRLRNA